MSAMTKSAFNLSRLVAGTLIAGTIAVAATAASAGGFTHNGVSEPGHLSDARALLRTAPAAERSVELPTPAEAARQRPKAAWEDCEPGSYWMVEGPDRSTMIVCR